MTKDIVARLRVLNHHAKKLAETHSLHQLYRDAFTRCENLTWEAAGEIERLRAERNQLRAEIVDRVLGFGADVPWNTDSKARMKCEAYAAKRGWFGLFDEINKRVSESEAADA